MSGGGAPTLRPATDADREFLRQVYAESRAEELAATPWSEPEKAAFCRSQFEAQDQYYRTHYPTCEYLIIEQQGEAVGRLYRDLRQDEIRVVDIALLARMRGQGLGGQIMRGIQAEAASAGLKVRIHVEKTNPARRLYDRLGFREIEAGDVYDLLAWEFSVNQD